MTILASLASSVATFYTVKNSYSGVIAEQREESNLQAIALSQLLNEKLDHGESDALQKLIRSSLTASLAHSNPDASYPRLTKTACKIHQKIHRHQINYPEVYKATKAEERIAKNVLEYWRTVDCGR